MVITVPRPRWTPETATDEQRQLVDAVERAFRQRGQWERGGYAAIRAAQAAGVPMEYLVSRAKVWTKTSTATVYRHISEAEESANAEPGIVAELPPEQRAAAERELAAAGWSERDFLLASFAMLRENPGPYLDRLDKVYGKARKRRRS
jgi:hypothetical protein